VLDAFFSDDPAVRPKKSKTSSLTFPWWFLYVTYALCLLLAGVSILFIIARGIEFGDAKAQKWLISILTGVFSSILLTQPIKVNSTFSFLCIDRKILIMMI
jgi:hypothetical protein